MDEFLFFVQDNYIWFIIIGVLLVMAFIGFIAEKTDFGNKISIKKKEKPVKEEKIKEEKPEKVKKEKPIKEKKNKKDKNNDNILGLSEDINEIDGEGLDLSSMGLGSLLEETTDEPIVSEENISEDLTAPLVEETNSIEEIPEELTVPFGDTDINEGIEESIIEPIAEPEKEVIEEEIIEEPKETEEVTNDEDDVWKF